MGRVVLPGLRPTQRVLVGATWLSCAAMQRNGSCQSTGWGKGEKLQRCFSSRDLTGWNGAEMVYPCNYVALRTMMVGPRRNPIRSNSPSLMGWSSLSPHTPSTGLLPRPVARARAPSDPPRLCPRVARCLCAPSRVLTLRRRSSSPSRRPTRPTNTAPRLVWIGSGRVGGSCAELYEFTSGRSFLT